MLLEEQQDMRAALGFAPAAVKTFKILKTREPLSVFRLILHFRPL
ncbi:MAG: hypothetical protein R6U52_02185 [Kosmotogaceae bacterium]